MKWALKNVKQMKKKKVQRKPNTQNAKHGAHQKIYINCTVHSPLERQRYRLRITHSVESWKVEGMEEQNMDAYWAMNST